MPAGRRVPSGLTARTSGSSGSLKRHAILGRLACGSNDGGNWAHNSLDGRHFGGEDAQNCRGTLEWHPTDSLTRDLIGDVSHGTVYPATESLALTHALPAGAIPALGPVYVGDPFARRPDFDSLIDSNSVALHAPQFTTTSGRDARRLAS